jgi:hypothetical protein
MRTVPLDFLIEDIKGGEGAPQGPGNKRQTTPLNSIERQFEALLLEHGTRGEHVRFRKAVDLAHQHEAGREFLGKLLVRTAGKAQHRLVVDVLANCAHHDAQVSEPCHWGFRGL